MFDNTKQFLIVYSFQTIKKVLLIMKLDEKYLNTTFKELIESKLI